MTDDVVDRAALVLQDTALEIGAELSRTRPAADGA
jgi:hypothetical protein